MRKSKTNNMKRIVTIIICGLSFGATVQLETAEIVARSIYYENSELHDGVNFYVSEIETIKEGDLDLIYIFHLNPEGFIMVPADDQAVPNLAFGFDHPFESENMPHNLQALIDQYKMELLTLINNQAEPSDDLTEKWDYYLSGNVLPSRDRDVSPLMDAKFDQGGSWNNGVTSAIGFNGPVGCVAVAMSQVMHYWKYPEVGQGSNYYTENDYGYIEVDFEDAYYDFDNMAATYATPPSQLLLFHAGVAVNMDYDGAGSGAMVVGSYPSAFYAMENFFAYSSNIFYEWKSNHSDNEYRDIIINELDNSRPVISQGYGGSAGHAWNFDGYSGNNLHCNWGWGGSSNGYYNLSTMGGFPDDQAVILGILPQMPDPIALFEYEVNDETVTFIDLSSIVNEITISTWNWDFGDGNTSSLSTPEYTYQNGGEYEVTLVVTNMYGMISEPHTEIILIQSDMQGDVNGDSVLNILDIVIILNFVLGNDTPTASEFSVADLNNDGLLNILDIVTLTNLILEA